MLRSEQKDGRVVFKGCFLFVGIFLKLYFPVGFPYIKHVHCVLMSYILTLFINTNKQIELWRQRSFTYSLTHNSAVWEQQFNSIQPTINILQVSDLAISGLKYNERSTFLANALSYCQWLPCHFSCRLFFCNLLCRCTYPWRCRLRGEAVEASWLCCLSLVRGCWDVGWGWDACFPDAVLT